jgi:hypothetical protein
MLLGAILHIAYKIEILGEFVNSTWMNIGEVFKLLMMWASAIALMILYMF